MSLLEREQATLIPTYRRLNLQITRGEGVFLFDQSGKKYLDLFGGLAVNLLGYGQRNVLEAIQGQIRNYVHLSNLFLQPAQIELAESLKSFSGFDRIFFCNSGTEATEGAIKLVRKWGTALGRSALVAFHGGFHGRTMGALSLMAQEKYREGYEPFLDDCHHLPFNDVEALERNIDENTCAVFLEFIQGEAGIIPASNHFIDTLKDLRKKYGFLVVADEIQSGLGRTGKFFAFDHWSFEPDVVLLAKGLGGGLPLGAILVQEHLSDVYGLGRHGTTFGGNPVACAAGKAVIDTIRNERLMESVVRVSEYFLEALSKLKARFDDTIVDVRGKGMMMAIELNCDAEPFMQEALERGLLVNVTQGKIIRLLPPLIFTEDHADDAVRILTEAFASLSSEHTRSGQT